MSDPISQQVIIPDKKGQDQIYVICFHRELKKGECVTIRTNDGLVSAEIAGYHIDATTSRCAYLRYCTNHVVYAE